MKPLTFFTSLILLCFTIKAQPSLSVKQLLDSAYRQASYQKKNIFIIFHASWCGWCHKMDNSMNDSSCKKFFDDNYITVHLTVDESEANKKLENLGANKFRKKYNGDKAGLPFWLIIDKNGKLLADSQIRPEGSSLETSGNNIGCPASEEEVIAFIKILKKTSSLNDSDMEKISTRFKQNKQ